MTTFPIQIVGYGTVFAVESLDDFEAVMRAQLMLGRDLIVRAVAFQVAFLSAAAVAARMGTAQLAAHQIGLQPATTPLL